METNILKGRYVPGKVDYNDNGRRDCEAEITWELAKGRFSMSAGIWNPRKTDLYTCGQCVDTVAAYFPRDAKVQRMLEIWQRWHLNDMKAGSPRQQEFLRNNPKPESDKRDNYTYAREALTAAGLQPDTEYLREEKPYSYGSAWITEELPVEVTMEIRSWGEGFPAKPDPFTAWLDDRYTFEAVYAGEDGGRGDHYRCTFTEKLPEYDGQGKRNHPKKLSADFYQGTGHRKDRKGNAWSERAERSENSAFGWRRFDPKKSAPTMKTVMDALLNDAHAYDENRDMADFIATFGYDDIKAGRRVWQACEEQYSKLQAFTGANFRALMDDDTLPA